MLNKTHCRRAAVKALTASLLAALLPFAEAADNLPPDIGGVWQATQYIKGIRTLDGALPPLTAEGKAAYDANLAERKQMKPRNDMTRCVPSGTPRAMFAPLPLMVMQTARKITFIQEYHHQLRHIYLDEPVPDADAIELSFMGESVGHWEGDTLVIDTIGLHRDTVLDHAGLPHTTDMRISERLRLLDGGKQLENVLTFTDPAFYSAPWSTRVVYDSKNDVQLKEYNCLNVYEDL
jgi:hypothetical protein